MLQRARRWLKRRKPENDLDPGALAPRGPGRRRDDFYAADYDIMRPIGQSSPTPKFNGPALVWHLALWPDEEKDPQNIKMAGGDERPHLFGTPPNQIEIREEIWKRLHQLVDPREPVPGGITRDKFHEASVDQYYTFTSTVDDHLKSLLEKLARLGRPGGHPVNFQRVDPTTQGVVEKPKYDGSDRFGVLKREALPFTIWWPDDGPLNGRTPGIDALRIRTQIEVRPDYLTISFYLDVNQLWQSRDKGAGKITEPLSQPSNGGDDQQPNGRGAKPAPVSRRARIKKYIEQVQKICDGRIDSPLVSREFARGDVTEADKQALLDASKYLYDEIWDEFCVQFDLGDPAKLTGIVGDDKSLRVFANFRGLVLPTRGSNKNPAPEIKPAPDGTLIDPSAPGLEPFARFDTNDGSNNTPNEANAVVKAWWPFIQRFTTHADDKDFVACTVMGRRAIYVTALGAQSDATTEDEVRNRMPGEPSERLREEEAGYNEGKSQPLRYLFLTKGAPNPRQIGKIVDRINALGTMRHYALKDWYTLRNAGEHVRMRGQELDRIIRDWTDGRAYVDYMFNQEYGTSKAPKKKRQEAAHDFRDEWIARFTRDIETRLLAIGAALDKIGAGTTGGIHYRISRSRYYVREFMVLLETLRVGNIDSWLSYEQFVRRGLSPAFAYIDNLGDRLDALRRRLQAVIEGIQTSALVAQISATRENTTELKKIGHNAVALIWVAKVLAVFTSLYYVLGAAEKIWSYDWMDMTIRNILAGAVLGLWAIAAIITARIRQ
jgi:hypothetical protein